MSEVKKKTKNNACSETAIIYLHREDTALNSQNFSRFSNNTQKGSHNIYLGISQKLAKKHERETKKHFVKCINEQETDLKIFIDLIKSEQILDKYKKIIFTTSSTCGPFIRPAARHCWVEKFTSNLTGDVHLNGPFISLLPMRHPLVKHVQTKRSQSSVIPYIPLTTFAITAEALSLLIRNRFFETVEYAQEDERIVLFDIPVTTMLLQNGWNISCMLDKYSKIDYRTTTRDPNQSSHHGDPSLLNSFFGKTASRNDLMFSDRVCDQPTEKTPTRKISRLNCYMITYDRKTQKSIETGFKKLDNTAGPPILREIYPITKFLAENTIPEFTWIGFFSPKFREKTKLNHTFIQTLTNEAADDIDVCLFSSDWAGAAAHQNVWVQGEYHHPGLLEISQELADSAGYSVDLKQAFLGLDKAVFSNFFVAKSAFWKEWLRVTSLYLQRIVSSKTLFAETTSYRGGRLAIHPFIIERIPSMILLCNNFKSKFDIKAYNETLPVDSKIGHDLIKMSEYKRLYTSSSNAEWLAFHQYYLSDYASLIKEIQTRAN